MAGMGKFKPKVGGLGQPGLGGMGKSKGPSLFPTRDDQHRLTQQSMLRGPMMKAENPILDNLKTDSSAGGQLPGSGFKPPITRETHPMTPVMPPNASQMGLPPDNTNPGVYDKVALVDKLNKRRRGFGIYRA